MQPSHNTRSKRNLLQLPHIRPLKLFRSIDYLPFVFGVYFIGCLVAVPVILLSLLSLNYLDTPIWSVLAGTTLLMVIRTDGTISMLRVIIAVMMSGIIIALFKHHPMFSNIVLGCILSTLLLLLCGKFATTLSRAQRGRMDGFGLAVLGIGVALFMWFVFGMLGGIIVLVISLFGTITGLAAAFYGCQQMVRGDVLDPRILKVLTPNRLNPLV